MKQFLKYFSLSLFVSLLFFSFSREGAFASDELDFTPCEPAETLGSINRDLKITINGEENPLFCEFEDREKAMQTLKERIPEYLEKFAKENKLKELDSTNWKQYKVALRETDFPPTTEEGRLLNVFLGTYEDTDLNKETIKYVTAKKGEFKDSELVGIASMLPYNSKVSVANNEKRLAEQKLKNHINAVNMTSARAYASAYSWNPNTAYLYYAGADCTNYVSQILNNSGVPQTSAWYPYSTPWINTPAFASTMGVGASYGSNHLGFSQAIGDGNVILLDSDKNYTWDHAGFVTYQNSSPAQYNNGYYYDYMVTQHSSNYYKWAHESGNGWPTAGGYYGRAWGF